MKRQKRVKTGEFLNSDIMHNHDSCYEVYTNSDMTLSGTL